MSSDTIICASTTLSALLSAASAAPAVRNTWRLRYCAPEAVADPAFAQDQQPPRPVRGAADIWAIGVIAFELLTQERVFPPEATDESIMGVLRGRALPWEAGVEGQTERCGRLRGLRRAVMACLERDPLKRPSAESLLSSWEHVFDSMKTQGTFAASGPMLGGPDAQPQI